MGDQPLHRVVAGSYGWRRGACSDRREFFIGLRTVAIERTRLREGAAFASV